MHSSFDNHCPQGASRRQTADMPPPPHQLVGHQSLLDAQDSRRGLPAPWERRLRTVTASLAAANSRPSAPTAAAEAETTLQIQQQLAALRVQQDTLSLELAASMHRQHGEGLNFTLHPAAFFASADEASMLEFFRANGYWVVPGAVSGPELAAVQAGWLAATVPARAEWEAELMDWGEGNVARR